MIKLCWNFENEFAEKMISKKCEYAMRAVLYLAVESHTENRKGAREIAEALKIPSPFLGKILQELVTKNIITSAKGPNGGFCLDTENLQTPILKIIETIDGPGFFESCGLGLSECSEKRPCPIHADFKKARDHLRGVFERKTVQDLAEEIKSHDFILVR